ncbi:hypothetical protein [Larkinella rosea]|uniref:hypothetical protein n=1 Tax=Larkinella rosea TaxID=2025312 RepID=UPI001639DC34|nr:hypothetical protein [Larkinella rosea]
MKALSLIIGLLAILTVVNLYSFLMEEFDTNRQAFIAGVLTMLVLAVMVVLILNVKRAK